MQQENPLRALPSVNELLQDERLVALEAEYGHALAVDAARNAIDAARERIAAGEQGLTPGVHPGFSRLGSKRS